MLVAVFAAFAVATTASLMFWAASTSTRTAETARKGVDARFLAEGAVQLARKEVLDALANWGAVPASGSASIDGKSVPYTIVPTGFTSTLTDASGIQTLLTGYQIEAVAEVGGIQARARQIFNSQATPIFQYAVFYTEDLEIFPGPSMTLGGRVHTNADLYLGSNGTLTCNTNHVRAVGDIYRNRKDNPTKSPGTVRIREWVANPFDPAEPTSYFEMKSQSQMTALGVLTASGYDSRFSAGFDADGDGDFDDSGDWLPWVQGALEYWSEASGYFGGTGHTVLSADQGTTQAVVPSIGSIQMFEPTEGGSGGDYALDPMTGEFVSTPPGDGTHTRGFYHAQADLVIVGHADGSWSAHTADGVDVTGALEEACVVNQSSLYDARQDRSSSGTYPGNSVPVLEIDVAQLNGSGYFPANGLLYAASYGMGTGAAAKGAKLVNGATLAGPLTMVSEGSIYVQGDTNTTGKQPAAVICDAVHLLSNDWDGLKTSSSSLPVAAETTYNLAFITGNLETQGSSYNGGFENLPRFHENWSGKTCAITGSFVNAWRSAFATGAWVYGGKHYTAPNRAYVYDSAFNSVENLPPFTPMAVTAADVVTW
jgi:hypothetical protein